MTWKQFKPQLSVERGVIALLLVYLVLTLIQLDRVPAIADAAAHGWVLVFMVVRLAIMFVISGIAVSALTPNKKETDE